MKSAPFEAYPELKEAWKSVQPMSCDLLESIFTLCIKAYYPTERSTFDYNQALYTWTPSKKDQLDQIKYRGHY